MSLQIPSAAKRTSTRLVEGAGMLEDSNSIAICGSTLTQTGTCSSLSSEIHWSPRTSADVRIGGGGDRTL